MSFTAFGQNIKMDDIPEENINEAPVVKLPGVTITDKRKKEETFFLGFSKKQTLIGAGLIVALAIAAFFYFKK